MKKQLRNLLLILFMTASVSAFAGPTPRATVQAFLIAARAGNMAGVKRCLNGGNKLGNADASGIAAMRLMFKNARITRIEKVNSYHFVVYVRITNPATDETENFPMSVKKINGDWKICDSK